MIPFIITMLVFLLGVYYVTIVLHFLDISIFKENMKIHIGKSFIPFYYWFKSNKENVPQPTTNETVVKEIIVEKPKGEKKKSSKKTNKKKNVTKK